LRIYLDNCCFNRPYDSQSDFKILLETRAKLHVQEAIRCGKFEMIGSYMLEFENEQNTDRMKKKAIRNFQQCYSSFYVPIERREKLQSKIAEIMEYHISYKDATHVACAIYAKCDCLLTTDTRLMKRYKGNEIIILNPVDFIRMEEEEGL